MKIRPSKTVQIAHLYRLFLRGTDNVNHTNLQQCVHSLSLKSEIRGYSAGVVGTSMRQGLTVLTTISAGEWGDVKLIGDSCEWIEHKGILIVATEIGPLGALYFKGPFWKCRSWSQKWAEEPLAQ